MPSILQDSRGGAGGGGAAGQKYYGVVVGIVTNNQDPEKMHRVKVKFPWLTEDHESNWARVCSPMTGKDWGVIFLPEVNDEVLVAFEQGDIRYPYVLGTLYNGKEKPVVANDDGKNNIRQIKSRSGHIIEFDDTDGSEKLTIKDKSGNQLIEMDSKGSSIKVNCGGATTFSSSGKFTIDANDVEIKAKSNIKIEATGNFEAKGTGSAKLEASGNLTLKGAQVGIN